MALSDPLQLFSVLFIGAGIFLFDPQKIPETVRAIGRARREFESAQRTFKQMTSETQGPAVNSKKPHSGDLVSRLLRGSAPAPLSQSEDTSTEPRRRTADEILLDTAHELKISTAEKTREEISQEILTKIRSVNQQSPVSATSE